MTHHLSIHHTSTSLLLVMLLAELVAGCSAGKGDPGSGGPSPVANAGTPGAEQAVGERLFLETRFAQDLPPGVQGEDTHRPMFGLDPQARLALWDVLRRLHGEGRTIVMTTHYMQEADELCDRLAIVDQGRLLACDSPAKLKALAPGDTRIDLSIEGDAEVAAAACRALDGVTRVDVAAPDILAYAARGGELIPILIRAVEQVGARVRNINLAKPSLESLFVSLTGRKLE